MPASGTGAGVAAVFLAMLRKAGKFIDGLGPWCPPWRGMRIGSLRLRIRENYLMANRRLI